MHFHNLKDVECELCANKATHLVANITRRKSGIAVDVFQALCGPCHRDHESIFRWILEPVGGGPPVRGRIPAKGAAKRK